MEYNLQDMWNELKGFFTDSREEYNEFYEEPNGDIYLVSDIDEVRKALVDDREKGVEVEDEDIAGFLDRHGIEWE